jgi:hypothetical protein
MSTGPKYKGHATCSTVGPAKIVWILSNECCPVMQAELSTDRPLSLSSSQISGMKDIRQQNRQLWPSITIHFSWNNCSAIVGDLVAPLHLVIFSHAPIQVCRYGHRAGRLSHKVFRQRLIVPVCTNIDSLISALLTGEIDDIVLRKPDRLGLKRQRPSGCIRGRAAVNIKLVGSPFREVLPCDICHGIHQVI